MTEHYSNSSNRPILYIGFKHCTSVDQLKEYFSMNLTPDSDIYADLLDYGRYGDISEWLCEMGEPALASRVDSIDKDLSDSVFYGYLKAAITGQNVPEPDTVSLKPPFVKCFSYEGLKYRVLENEAKVSVSLKVLMCVNETYELTVSSNWGMRAEQVNPYSYPEGKIANFEFTFRKRPGKKLGELTVSIDGKDVLQSSVNSSSHYFGNETIKELIIKRKLSQIIISLLSVAHPQ